MGQRDHAALDDNKCLHTGNLSLLNLTFNIDMSAGCII